MAAKAKGPRSPAEVFGNMLAKALAQKMFPPPPSPSIKPTQPIHQIHQ